MVASDLNGTWGKTRGKNEARMGREPGKLGSPSPKHTSSKVINHFSTLIFSFREGSGSLISSLFLSCNECPTVLLQKMCEFCG